MYESSLLNLPLEILLIIVRFVTDSGSADEECCEVTFINRTRYSCLLSLSCVHSILRQACFMAGLFRQICPRSTNPKVLGVFKEFHTRPQLISLSVDLWNSKVWIMCAQLMKMFPDLDELRLLRGPARSMVLFYESTLSYRFSLFKGSSLVIKSACFNHISFPILMKIGRKTITSLYFDKSKLYFSNTYSSDGFPMFPNLKRVKFVGVPVTSDQYRADAFDSFVDVFLVGCQLTHLEISYGFGPFCSAKRISDLPIQERLKRMVRTNVEFVCMRKKLLLALRRSSFTSLKVFIDHDHLEETFIADYQIFRQENNIPLPLFQNMKLLVFRIDDLALMCQEYSPNDESCDSISALRGVRRQFLAQHHHSVWLHISYQYSLFSECECIFIETKPCNNTFSFSSFRDYPIGRLMTAAHNLESRAKAPLYLIIGNHVDSYQGIERATNILAENDTRKYKILEEYKCKHLLFELSSNS